MRRLWPRRRPRDLTRRQLLDGMTEIVRYMRIEHHHTVKHEPIPAPLGATVVFKRIDGSESYRYHLNCGRSAYTRFQVPMYALIPDAPASQIVDLEFQWDR